MKSSISIAVSYAVFGLSYAAIAQGTLPTKTQEISDREMDEGSAPITIDLSDIFGVSGVTGPIVQFVSNFGTYNVELFPTVTPGTATNFLNYVNDGDYTNSVVHRADDKIENNESVPFVIQGGGFTFDGSYPVDSVPTDPPIVNEFNLSNTRGTIAMAKTSNPDSATSQWFINLGDNDFLDDPSNSGGFTVFGQVIGSGMDVVDGIAALPRWNFGGSTFTTVPLSEDFTNEGGALPTVDEWVRMSSVDEIPLYPESGSPVSVLGFNVTTNSNPGLVTTLISNTELQISSLPGQPGFADITVTATDTHGNDATDTFRVTVKSTQTIEFSLDSETTVGDPPITLSASATSGLPVGYRIISGLGTINGHLLTPTSAGSVVVEAFQAGDASYAAASPVRRTIVAVPNAQRWETQFFPDPDDRNNPAVSGDHVDLTGDGINNLLAYAFNVSPHQTHLGILPSPSIDDQNRLTINFIRDTRATDLDYRVEAGPSLSSLQTIAQSIGGGAPTGSAVISESGDSSTRTIVVSDTSAGSEANVRFIRLVVTRNSGQ